MLLLTWAVQPIGTAMYRVSQKIKQCRVNLLQWSQSHVRVTPNLIDTKMTHLKALEEQPPELYASGEIYALRRKVNFLREKEEIFWRQRSRVSWLAEGDKNTKFFHECASQRRRTNTIAGLRDHNNIWQSVPSEVEHIAVGYFNDIFATSFPDAISSVVQEVDSVVTSRMNNELLRAFSHDEVRRALFEMHPSKAPGPDGMSALFFKKFGILLVPMYHMQFWIFLILVIC
jgi:hypothetical protein